MTFSYDMSQQLKKSPEFIAQARAAFEADNPLATGLWNEEHGIYHPMYHLQWSVFLTGFSYGAQLRASK